MRLSLLAVLALLSPGELLAQAPRTLSVVRDLLIPADKADLSEAFIIAISPRGHIAVPQPGDGHIKVFSPTGAMTTVGRTGEGPGEFRRANRVGYLGDSLWALDVGTSRISLFGPDLKLARSFAEPFSAMKAMQAPAGVERPVITFLSQAVLSNGDLRAVASWHQGAPRPAWAADVDSGATLLVRISPLGAYQRRLAVHPKSRCTISYTVAGGSGSTRIPFCAARVSTDWDATIGIAMVDTPEPRGTNAHYRVAVIRERGDTLFDRSYPFTAIPVTKGALDSVEASDAESRKGVPPSFAQGMPKPKPESTYPPVRRVVLGRDNTVWLELRTTSGGHRWLVLDPRGNQVGLVQLPYEVTLRVAERGMFWGVATDEDGLQGIVRYRVAP
ncbi:MAG: hypothetical protein ABIZ70_15855 [Gemmatimonadales bacterium]